MKMVVSLSLLLVVTSLLYGMESEVESTVLLQAKANLGIAKITMKSFGTEQDYDRARSHLERALSESGADKGTRVWAAVLLAQLYYLGHGVVKDKEKAASYINQAKKMASNEVIGEELGELIKIMEADNPLSCKGLDGSNLLLWACKKGFLELANFLYDLHESYDYPSMMMQYAGICGLTWLDTLLTAHGVSDSDSNKLDDSGLTISGAAENKHFRNFLLTIGNLLAQEENRDLQASHQALYEEHAELRIKFEMLQAETEVIKRERAESAEKVSYLRTWTESMRKEHDDEVAFLKSEREKSLDEIMFLQRKLYDFEKK